MLRKSSWASDRAYRSGTASEPMEFYLTALANSKRFDLLLGYFSSTAINVLALGFAKFLHGGGTMRVVANNVLSAEDKKAIEEGQGGKLPDDLLDLSDIRALKASLGDTGRHFMECFAWLIAQGRIQFVIVRPKGRLGIAHYKSGVFSDGQEQIGFKASCNFTAFGMLENLEELEAFASWDNGRSTGFLQNQNSYFEALLSGKNEQVEYVPVKDVEVAIRSEFGDKDLNELLWQEKELISSRNRAPRSRRLDRLMSILEVELDALSRKPRFPIPTGPRAYQQEAYDQWLANDRKGIFAMATGTGKTITALNAVLNEYNLSGTYQCIILVPTRALVNQWYSECSRFNLKNIILVSSGHNWRNRFATLMLGLPQIDSPFVLISTYASFARNAEIRKLFKINMPNAILIADEAHNLGSNKIQALLKDIRIQRRIGLSATISRKRDEIGNSTIEGFFNDKHPYTFSLDMREAIDKGFLCRYYYKPHVVSLTNEEMVAYKEITARIARLYNFASDSAKQSDVVSQLLIARKRIVDKAERKLPLFRSIMTDRFQSNGSLANSLVYVPEGNEPDYSSNDDVQEDEDDLKLIDQYTRATRDVDPSVHVRQFTAQTVNRGEILDAFANGSLHVITSMKCLDEGVDIPRADFAVFCASSGNPRQFIQRRGRVLRLADGKDRATIHDMIVVPQRCDDLSSFNLEKKLFQRELERVADFALLSENPMDGYLTLKETLDYYQVSIYDSTNTTSHD